MKLNNLKLASQDTCPLGDRCRYAHGVFEVWLHPSTYRTIYCTVEQETGQVHTLFTNVSVFGVIIFWEWRTKHVRILTHKVEREREGVRGSTVRSEQGKEVKGCDTLARGTRGEHEKGRKFKQPSYAHVHCRDPIIAI